MGKQIAILVFTLLINSACTLSSSNSNEDNINEYALIVNTTKDTFDESCSKSDCSLRDAIYLANLDPDYHEIILPAGTYKLNQSKFYANDDSGIYGDIDIFTSIAIYGDGKSTIIDGLNRDRVFHILEDGALTLSDMSLINGDGDDPDYNNATLGDCVWSFFTDCSGLLADFPDDFTHSIDEVGGGIISNRGFLELHNVFISGGTAIAGGGILNYGEIIFTGGTVCNNQAKEGGGIANYGDLSLFNVEVCENSSFQKSEWDVENYNDFPFGGGIVNSANGYLQIYDSLIRDNETEGRGGGIINYGEVFIRNTSVSDGLAEYGGGIYNDGIIKINALNFGETLISNNQAKQYGGNIYSTDELTINNAIISDGRARTSAGIMSEGNLIIKNSAVINNIDLGLYAGVGVSNSGNALIENVTFSGNQSANFGAVIYTRGGNTSIVNVTIFRNNGKGILLEVGEVKILNTILAENWSNCNGNAGIPLTSLGHNLEDKDQCDFNAVGDMPNTEPLFLDNNFSDVSYFQLHQDSEAINSGANNGCPSVDQLNKSRPIGNQCDIGAIEFSEQVLQLPPPIATETPQVFIEVPPTIDDIPPFVADQDANCRKGPATIYTVITIIFKGESGIILGQNIANDWVFVKLITDQECWVWEGALTEDSVFENVEVLPDPPTPTFTPSPTLTPTPTPTLTPIPADSNNASISGFSWNDNNGNGSKNSGEGLLAQTSVKLGSGACNSTGLQSVATNFVGAYAFTGLSAGTYCVSATRTGDISAPSTSTNVTVVLTSSQSVSVNFGFQEVID